MINKYLRYYLSIFIFLFFSFMQLHANEKELDWKSFNFINFSELPIEIREIMKADLKTYFDDGAWNDKCRSNNDFNSGEFANERMYYFDNNIAINVNDHDDFICLKQINAEGDIYVKHNYDGWYTDFDISYGITINFSTDISSSEEKFGNSQLWRKKWNQNSDNDPWEWEKNANFSATNIHKQDEGNPIIPITCFERVPDDYFKIKYHYLWKHKNPNKYQKLHWNNEEHTSIYFKALSPKPMIDKDTVEKKHHTKLTDLEINTIYGVKILIVKVYKIDVNGDFIIGSEQEIKVRINENENKIDNITIPASFFNDEGEYRIVLGAIDKFNKISIFEPEEIVIDRTNPQISPNPSGTLKDKIVNDKTIFNGNDTNVVIMEWGDVSDNSTIYGYEKYDEENYLFNHIYINNGEWSSAKPASHMVFNHILELDSTNKQIKLKKEGALKITEMYFDDRAGNYINLLSSPVQYIWDKNSPDINLSENTNTNKFFKSSESVEFEILDDTKVKINQIIIKHDGIEYDADYNVYPSYKEDIVEVALSSLENKEGLFKIKLSVDDETGNQAVFETTESLKIDDKAPDLVVKLDDDLLNSFNITDMNNSKNLTIQSDDYNFDKIEIEYSSNSIDRTILSPIYDKDYTYEIYQTTTSKPEELIITIKAFDQAGNYTTLENLIFLLNRDNGAPEIYTTLIESWKYRVQVYDESIIKNIFSKYINISGISDININDFSPLLPDNSWEPMAQNVKNYDQNIELLPESAVCLFAEDKWGNITTDGVILENNLPAAIIIEDKSDLIAAGWNLFGDIIIKDTIIIEPGEVLNISSYVIAPTTIKFNGSNNGIKIINNGGTINIDSTINEIFFTSTIDSQDEYKWFGIQNKSGAITFTGSNKIYFEKAISGLSFLNPANDVVLNNIKFSDCFMGIHIIDQCLSYNNLNINNIIFENLVYGLKFDIDSFENADTYVDAQEHLIISNCQVGEISKGHVYCPIRGVFNLEGFNTAPIANSLSIMGDLNIGDILTGSYSYFDEEDLEDLTTTGTVFGWYSSNKKTGPYSKIMNADSIDWTIETGFGGKWIRFSIIPKDERGAVGSIVYSDPVEVNNNPPSISDLEITGELIYGKFITANYTFNDPEGDSEGLSKYKWYISDTFDGSYTEIEGANSKRWMVSSLDYSKKWIKYEAIPFDETGMQGEIKISDPVQLNSFEGPYAIDINITGTLEPGNTLTGHYTYVDTDNFQESNSSLKWYYSDTQDGVGEFIGVTEDTLYVNTFLGGKWVYFEYIPRNELQIEGPVYKSEPVKIKYNPPFITSIYISGLPKPGYTLTGHYTYHDPADIEEGESIYKWYYSDSTDADSFEMILDDNDQPIDTIDFEITDEYAGKYIKFEMTAINNEGIVGQPVKSDYIKVYNKIKVTGIIEFKAVYGHSWKLADFHPDLMDVTADIIIVGAGGGGGGGGGGDSYTNWDGSNTCEDGSGGGGGGAGQYLELKNQKLYINSDYEIYIGTGGGSGSGGGKHKHGKSGAAGEASYIRYYNPDTGQIEQLVYANPGQGGQRGKNEGKDDWGDGGTGYPNGQNNVSNGKGGNGGDNGLGYGERGNRGSEGNPAPDNTGGGGGGGGGNNCHNSGRSGGNGGSGYVRIKWTGYRYEE